MNHHSDITRGARLRLAAVMAVLTMLAAGCAANDEPTSRAAGSPPSSAPSAPASVGVELTPVIQSVLSTPRWYEGDDGRFHLQYELVLTNTVPLPVDVIEIEVLSNDRRVDLLTGDALAAAMAPLGNETAATTTLPASTVSIAWMDLSFESRSELPAELSHRVTVDVGSGLPVGPTIVSTGAPAVVSQQQPVVIAPPLRGGRWVSAGGVAGPHRRALQAVDGHLRLGQRFAVDFAALLDAEGRSQGDAPDANAAYLNYAQPVLAVGEGTVVDVADGRPDQIPNENTPVPLAEAGGNEVILELDEGVYVGYGHLRPGSVRVEPGQRVRAGDVLGELGNSGNSTGPHLHLQLMTEPSFLAADGLPFVIDEFSLDGVVPSLDALLEADAAGTPMPIDVGNAGDRHQQGITGLDVVTFPGL